MKITIGISHSVFTPKGVGINMKVVKRIHNYFQRRIALRSSDNYIKYLRKKGVKIGEGTHISQRTCKIDITRPSLVTIGDNVYINDNFTLLTHDFVTGVFLGTGRSFINSSGRVSIGNNVGFGHSVMVLKGVTIGNNCFVGAGSIVTRDIPDNSIAVGAPCKVVMTLDEYYEKRLKVSEAEALDYARSIQERFHRKPVPADFWEEFIWFVSGNEINKYPEIPIHSQLGALYEKFKSEHTAKYHSFEDFLIAAGIR